MKNIKYILFTILFLFLNIFYVNASCTNEEIKELKDLSKDIRITYKHKGIIETEERTLYNQFDVTVKNLDDDLYVSLFGGSTELLPVNGIATIELNNGTWYFEIYSNRCNVLIDRIKVFLPKFNLLSLDPLCEGIDGDDFPLCGKYYEYDINYDEFQEKVISYREKKNMNNVSDNEKKIDFNALFKKVIDFVIEYKLYFIGSLIILFVILILIVAIKRNRKRGVLE